MACGRKENTTPVLVCGETDIGGGDRYLCQCCEIENLCETSEARIRELEGCERRLERLSMDIGEKVARIHELERGLDEYHTRITTALATLEEDVGSLDVAPIARAVEILRPTEQVDAAKEG